MFKEEKILFNQTEFNIERKYNISKDSSVRLLYEVTEELNYDKLNEAYAKRGRKSVISPKTLFRILIYGFMEKIYSSRDLEKACNRDINFIWLLRGEKAPDHNTIARFRSEKLTSCIDDLFNQLVIKLAEKEEIQYQNIFIDGTKIEANANRYTFVWKKSTEKYEAKLKEKIQKDVPAILEKFNLNLVDSTDTTSLEAIEELYSKLNELKLENQVEFVKGKGRRKSELQKSMELLEEFIEKQKKYNKYNQQFDGRNSFSKTDVDATFMHMKEDHMKNGQLKPGYNIQIGVEAEYIVGVDISSERSDQLTLIPFLDKLEKNLPTKFENVVTDSGYESEENLEYLDKNEYTPFIKPQNHRIKETKKFKKDIRRRENMSYSEQEDYYICAKGRKLLPINSKIKRTKSGFEALLTIYECENCSDCEYKIKCTRAKGNRQLHVSKNFLAKRAQSEENIQSPRGILLRKNRSIQVEGAFGVLKEDYRFRRFFTRGMTNVKVEFLLLAFGYNINKLFNKSKQNRTRTWLHGSEAA